MWHCALTTSILIFTSLNLANSFALVQVERNITDIARGNGYGCRSVISVPAIFWTGQDNTFSGHHSQLVVKENGVALPRAHAKGKEVAELGMGRYHHRGEYGGLQSRVYFSASDNSDPLTNHRSYSIKVPLLLNPLIFNPWILCPLGLLSAWLFLPSGKGNRTRFSARELPAKLGKSFKSAASYLIALTPFLFFKQHGLVGLPVLALSFSGIAFLLYAITGISAQVVTDLNCCFLATFALLALLAASFTTDSLMATRLQVSFLKGFLLKNRTTQVILSTGITCGALLSIANILIGALHASATQTALDPFLLNPYAAYVFGFGCLFSAWIFYSNLSASVSGPIDTDPGSLDRDLQSTNKIEVSQSGRLRSVIVLSACIAIAIGICFRSHNISYKPFWQDEAFTSAAISTKGFIHQEQFRKVLGKPGPADQWKELDSVDAGASATEVVRNLAMKSPPDQAPLYYLACRLAGKWFDYSDFSMRLLAVVFSIISLPLVFLLTRRMFSDPLCAWVATAVVATSPYQLVYSQEARPYTLWLCFVLLSFIALDQATKTRKARHWILFGCASAMACLSHLSSVLVTAATALPLLRPKYGNFRPKLFLGLFSFAVVFIPWIALTGIRVAGSGRGEYLNTALPPFCYILGIGENVARLFFDIPNSNIELPMFILAVSCVIFVYRRATPIGKNAIISTGLFLLFLGILDLVFGGLRLTVGRYSMPSLAILQICVAAAIVELFRGQRAILAAAVLLIVGGQLYSCSLIDQSRLWWPKSPGLLQEAALLNNAEHGLKIEPTHSLQKLQATRRLVNPTVMLELCDKSHIEVPKETTLVLVSDPSFVKTITKNGQWKIYQPSPATAKSWMLEKLADPANGKPAD